ncbi:hypothetical protein V8G54_013480 [Vigna mungo]|uniref:Uncharacterized protein n=1 Tax=Vigna mungo TaxID=3915 RepID=A0AAQ3NTS7_VIGMU
MRKSPSGLRLLENGNYSYHIKLGKATISVTRDTDVWNPSWQVVYDVDEKTSQLSIVKLPDDKSEYSESLSDGVKTQRWVYTCGTRKDLVVIENKKKRKEEQPYMVTVAHYYVNRDSGGSGVDIGFSAVVKIGVVNGKLDYSVDGPVQHPSSAIVYMIEEVSRTGKWKSSACPHCRNIQSQQRRWVSESEDSDNNLPTPPPSHGGQQSVSNMGRYNGDGIASSVTLTRSVTGEGAKGLGIRLCSVMPAQTGDFTNSYALDVDVQTVTKSDATVRTNMSMSNCPTPAIDRSEQFHEEGRVTETEFYFFRTGDAGSLTVLEMKKKKIEESRCYAVTLAHYFASINGFSRNETDVGLSVVVKIRVSKGNLEVTVEGPEQHPAFGLYYLFDVTLRTKIWKPTLCPHCATIQKQCSTMILQADSDDSESIPVARRHGASQKYLRLVDNGGKFNGNGNGPLVRVVGGLFSYALY